jgi:hypothetical protein
MPNTLLGIAIGLLLAGRFRWVDGVIEIYGRNVAAVLARLFVPAAALTMGHVVFGRDRHCLDSTRIHERVHVHQYERWGIAFLPAYILASVWLYARLPRKPIRTGSLCDQRSPATQGRRWLAGASPFVRLHLKV